MLAPPVVGTAPEVKGVAGNLDERVSKTAGERTVIAGARPPGQREDGGLDGRRCNGIEEATQGNETTLAGNELAAVALGGGHVLLEDCGRVICVAGTDTVVAEAADRVLACQFQEGALVESDGTEGCCARHSGLSVGGHGLRAEGTGGASQEREMGEPDVPGIKGSDAGGQPVYLLAGGNGPGSSMPGHVAVMTDPVDRGDRALSSVLVGGSEGRSFARKAKLEEIDAMPKPHQVIHELR